MTDAGDPAEVEAAGTLAVKTSEKVDILFYCAGSMPEVTALTTDVSLWSHVLHVDLTSMFLTAKAAVPQRYGYERNRIHRQGARFN